MFYNYFIPQIHLGPTSDYTFIQELPLDKIKNLIIGESAKFEISRKVISNKIGCGGLFLLFKFKYHIFINLHRELYVLRRS